ncbi:MAG: DEAD/DEAH box helicase [Verrucomicrobiota bacterium]
MTKISTFQELNLSPELTKAITEMGFESPTPIQCETLPILLSDPTDFMGLAATGLRNDPRDRRQSERWRVKSTVELDQRRIFSIPKPPSKGRWL